VALPSSSKHTCGILIATLCALVSLAAGCATVRPEEKEHLAEPSMSFGGDDIASEHEAHVISNREGSSGGDSTQGGGCGCN
jgi:hypothetical protein